MKQRKLFYGSSYDRGADIILEMWPKIHFKYPDSELHLCYGWDMFDKVTTGNAERQAWKAKVVEMMKYEGITEHGRLSKEELAKVRQSCGIWVFPTYFTEINCITAIDAQKDGLVPVVTDLAALSETVQSGVKVKGNINDKGVQGKYLDELLTVMGSREYWERESIKAKEFGSKFLWTTQANMWITEFEKPIKQPLVSILTPTNRSGFWNLMSHNISRQSYKNIEWVITDDYPKDRSEIAKTYAQKYGIRIKYLRSKDHTVKRNYGLVNADNTGIEHAEGELLVWLQDFILMPQTGIEQLVDLYNHNPNSLLAPCDVYHLPKVKPNLDSEDWFDGSLAVIGDHLRDNIRVQGYGIRRSENPFDWELNYGACPAHIAKELGGFYEFYDFGLGYNNTDLAYRALIRGYDIVVDDSNIAVCIDHWNVLEGTEQHGLGREHRLTDPHYEWMMKMIEQKKLPIKRTQEIDDQIDLTYEMPSTLSQDDAVKWMLKNKSRLVAEWLKKYKEGFV